MNIKENLSNRIKRVKPSVTNDSNRQAKELIKNGIHVFNLSNGDISLPTPEIAKNAAIEAIENDDTKYTLASGKEELRKAIADQYNRKYDLDYKYQNVLVGSGTKNVLFTLMGVLCNHDDEIIVPTPCWPSYFEQIKLFGATPKIVECGIETNFKLTPKLLSKNITSKTKAVILNSPNNPSGSVYSKDELAKLAEVLEEHDDIFIIFDDVYSQIVSPSSSFYNIVCLSKEIQNRTIIAGGISKNYGMTGWRIGWIIGPEEIISASSSFQSHSLGSAVTISQDATISLLKHVDESPFNVVFSERRKTMVRELKKIKELSFVQPQGACYIFLSINKLIGKKYDGITLKNSKQFCELALKYGHISVIPGEACGLEGYLRLSFGSLSSTQIKENMFQLKQFVEKFR